MHVIRFNTDLKKIHLVSLRYFQTYFPKLKITLGPLLKILPRCWLKKLRSDKRLVVLAAGQARKVADYIQAQPGG